MKWIRGCSFAVGILAVSAVAQAQLPPVVDSQAVDGRSIDKPQRSEDPAGFYRVNDVIGMTVKSRVGGEIGKIQDIVVDGRTDQIQYFLLQPVATTRIDGILIMPWTFVTREVRVNPGVEVITIDMPVDRIVQAPLIRRSELATFYTNPQRQVFQSVDQFYGTRHQALRPDFDDGNDRGILGNTQDRPLDPRGEPRDPNNRSTELRGTNPRTNPADAPKSDPRVAPKAEPKSDPRVTPKAEPKDTPADQPKDSPRVNPKTGPPTTPPTTPPTAPEADTNPDPKAPPKEDPPRDDPADN